MGRGRHLNKKKKIMDETFITFSLKKGFKDILIERCMRDNVTIKSACVEGLGLWLDQ